MPLFCQHSRLTQNCPICSARLKEAQRREELREVAGRLPELIHTREDVHVVFAELAAATAPAIEEGIGTVSPP